MAMSSDLALGGVYKTSFTEYPCRIIAYDEFEVLYDAYWPGLDKWTFASNLKRKGTYYRITPTLFIRDSRILEVKPLTDQELRVFIPHLPMRLCRFKELNWTENQIPSLEEFREYVNGFIGSFSEEFL
jgi:hypothetical protein